MSFTAKPRFGAPLAIALAATLSLSACAAPLAVGPTGPAGGPVAGNQPGSAAAGPGSVGTVAAASMKLSGVASHRGAPLAGVSVQVFDALTNKPVGNLAARRIQQAGRPSGLAAAEGVGTDAQGRFELSLEGLAPGRAVRVVVNDGRHRVETTLSGDQAPSSGELAVDDAATAQSLLARGLYTAAGAMVGAHRRFEGAPAPLGAVESARRELKGLTPDWAALLGSRADGLTAVDPAAARQRAHTRLEAMFVRLTSEVGPALTAVAGPAAEPTWVLRERATLNQELARAQSDLGHVLERLVAVESSIEWEAYLGRLDTLGATSLLDAFYRAAVALPASPRATELTTRLSRALIKAGQADFDTLAKAGAPLDRQRLVQRLLGGSTAECVAPDSAKRLDLTSPALQGMLRSTFESMDATRVLSLWEAIAQEPTLARLAGNITLDGIVCAAPIARLKAMHTLFDALAASPAEERQRATAAFVTLAARHAEFQGQLRRQLTQGGDPEIRALLDGLAPKTPDQLDAVLAGAYDIKAGNLQGLMVLPDAYPDHVLAPGVGALAEALASALTDDLEPAQVAALQAALADKALGGQALKVLAGATLGLMADIDRRHLQTSDPLDAPISFPGTTLELRPAGANTMLELRDAATGRTLGVNASADLAPLLGGVSGGSSGGGSSVSAPAVTITGFDYNKGWAGRTVTLSGTGFSPVIADNVVSFGGQTATVTAATSTLLTMTVPAVTIAGGNVQVTVSVKGQQATPQAFKVFQNPTLLSDFTAQATGLNAIRSEGAAASDGMNVYVIGGRGEFDLASNTSLLASVERVAVSRQTGANAGYTVASTTSLATPLVHARAGATAVVVGRRLYVLGGRGANDTLPPSEYANIQSDGSLSPFTAMTDNPLLQRAEHACVVKHDAIYLIGGAAGPSQQAAHDTVVRIPILDTTATGPSGGLDLAGAAAVLTDARLNRAAAGFAVSGDHAFLVGGFGTSAGVLTDTVSRLVFAANGSVSLSAQPDLPTLRAGDQAAVLQGKLYIFGGSDGMSDASPLNVALDASGAIPVGATYGSGVGSPRIRYAPAITLDDTVFTFGGFVSGGTGEVSEVSRAELDDPGP